MKKAITLSTLVFTLLTLGSYTQNVGINATGSAPDASAGLDVDFSDKGALMPRVALTSPTDATTIANPATSLLVYNTNSAMGCGEGYYYNAGTPGSPNWVKFETNTIATKKVEEYFSGNDINANWTKNTLQNSPTFSMQDGINGGYRIYCTGQDIGNITYNNMRHFDPTSCTFYLSIKGDATGGRTDVMGGLSATNISFATTNTNKVLIKQDSGSGQGVGLYVGNGVTESFTTISGANLVNNTPNVFKVVCTATSIKAYLLVNGGWVLKATDTTDLPTVAMQPGFECRAIFSTGGYTEALYFKAENN